MPTYGQLFRAFRAFDPKMTEKKFKQWYNSAAAVEARQKARMDRIISNRESWERTFGFLID